ncbi:MAG: TIGR01777 family oxidoreductase [Flavobacteriales bacterium]|nr:TIGR01777 family oxidoreductase [Flavobacteriales bacterium]
MKVLITGGTGLIGTELTKLLLASSHEVRLLSRRKGSQNGIQHFQWNPARGEMDPEAIAGVEAIVHLAGAGIADSRWTESRKRVIVDSRVATANLLFEKIKEFNPPLRAFISASGISYYGLVTSDKIYEESDYPSSDFVGECCILWEKAADQFSSLARVVKLRTGIVLSSNGGALEKIAQPIKFGLGARLGSGEQWVPYIHIEDLCKIYLEVLENEEWEGVYNAVNGDHVTNSELTEAVAKTLNKPLLLPNIPNFVLKMVFGEMANLILEGSRISAAKIKTQGFSFEHQTLEDSLHDIYHS